MKFMSTDTMNTLSAITVEKHARSNNIEATNQSTKNRSLKMSVAVCLLLAGVGAGYNSDAKASEFNYNEVAMSLAPDAIDGADPTLAFSGSYEFMTDFSVIGSHSNTQVAESRGVEVDFSITQLGVSYHRPLQLMAKTDVTADVRYVETNLTISRGSRSANLGSGSGYRVGTGIRHQYSDRIELQSTLSYLSVESEADMALSVGGHYSFSKNLSAGAAYTTGDFDGISGSVRWNF